MTPSKEVLVLEIFIQLRRENVNCYENKFSVLGVSSVFIHISYYRRMICGLASLD